MIAGGTGKTINGQSNKAVLSVLIVTFNAGAYLEDCLLSVIKQHFGEIELIIKDGGSTDGTLSIVRQFEKHIAYWESSADKGIYDAMNIAVTKARGKWIYFLGADDWLLDDFSPMCHKLQHEHTLYYGDCVSEKGILGGEYSAYKIAKYAICQQALFYPAPVFKKYQYDTTYKVFADYALNLQCWGDQGIKKQYYPLKVAWYNLFGFSSVANDDWFKQQKPLLIRKSMGWLMYLRFLYKRRKEQRRPGSNFY